ncbi:MAG: uroporphyrinogen-III synthase [Rhizobiales bacterium]|nr:uroporphyrinogen-III synthase [Hyphomicrobiales bacterium]
MFLLVTRPQDEGERTAAALRARGHDALLAPVLRIELLSDVDLSPDRWSAVLMTSGNAARAVAVHRQHDALLGLPLYAVGRQTANAARAAGFVQVISADGDAADLARLISGKHGGGTMLYLAGNDRARDLPGELAVSGLKVETIVVYRAIAAAELPSNARTAMEQGKLDGALHYSQRTARIILDCVQTTDLATRFLQMTHYCLSPRVAEPLVAAGAADIRIAEHPNEAALFGLIG